MFSEVKRDVSEVELGLHLHSTPSGSNDKISAALDAGCERLDGAVLGMGGCPFAEDQLVGNINTRHIIQNLLERKMKVDLDMEAFRRSETLAAELLK